MITQKITHALLDPQWSVGVCDFDGHSLFVLKIVHPSDGQLQILLPRAEARKLSAAILEVLDTVWNEKDETILGQPIEKLPLSVRLHNALNNDGIVTVGQIIEKTGYEILRLPNLGRMSLNELREVLRGYGLALKGDEKLAASA